MNKSKAVWMIIITVLAITVVGYIGSYFYNQKVFNKETKYMNEACQDISQFEMLRAQGDIDSLIVIITEHFESHDIQSNSEYSEILNDINWLKEELQFHNTDSEVYKLHFSNILRKLAYLELVNAKKHSKNNEGQLKQKIENASHFYHDAMFFSSQKLKDKEKRLIIKLHQALKTPEEQLDLDKFIVEAKELTEII